MVRTMDENRYLQLAQAQSRSMYRLARAILQSDADAADAVQQAVFQGWIHRRQLRQEEKFKAWLLRILVNECRSLQRRDARRSRLADALKQREEPPANETLAEALEALPEHYRLPVLLHYMEGYSVKEIGGILNVSPRRVTDCLYRARRKLEEELKL